MFKHNILFRAATHFAPIREDEHLTSAYNPTTAESDYHVHYVYGERYYVLRAQQPSPIDNTDDDQQQQQTADQINRSLPLKFKAERPAKNCQTTYEDQFGLVEQQQQEQQQLNK